MLPIDPLPDRAGRGDLYREAIGRLSRTGLRPDLARAPAVRRVASPNASAGN